MTKPGRSMTIPCLLFGAMILVTNSSAATRPQIAQAIADAYGLRSFDQIEAIRFTFNAQLPGVNVHRTWVWEPKTDRVFYEGKDKEGKVVKATYFRSQLGSAPANVTNVIDPAFLNDQYNLLFPLHVYWDESADVRDMGAGKLPLGRGSAKRVVVKYPSEGGYSQGDTWTLYVGRNDRVEEFTYRRGGTENPRYVIATWTGYKKAGPLLISTIRSGTADGKPLHILISNVAVKLVGSDHWVSAR